MAYIRTEEIKQKQSIKMRQATQSYDWVLIKQKAKETITQNGSKIGRPKGIPGKKTGWYKKCKMCNSDFWVVPSSDHRRVYCSRTCMHSDKVYIDKLRSMNKSYMQSEEYKNTKRDPNLPSYKKYANQVRVLTEQVYVKHVDVINPDRRVRTLCGVQDGWQLDHIKSIKKCYNEGMSVEQASDASNLQMIPWKDNLAKRTFEKVKN